MLRLLLASSLLSVSVAYAAETFTVTGAHQGSTCYTSYAEQDAQNRANFACETGGAVRISGWATTWSQSVEPCTPIDPIGGGTCAPEIVRTCYATAKFRCR